MRSGMISNPAGPILAALLCACQAQAAPQGEVLPGTVPLTWSIVQGLDIGQDVGSSVDLSYKPPFKFTARIDKVTFDLK